MFKDILDMACGWATDVDASADAEVTHTCRSLLLACTPYMLAREADVREYMRLFAEEVMPALKARKITGKIDWAA